MKKLLIAVAITQELKVLKKILEKPKAIQKNEHILWTGEIEGCQVES